ncbi:MAG: phage/plasmid primase, P4 family [Allosphingosinicella sp.]
MSRPNPLLEAALAFAARGWPVFPCNMANKKPLLAAEKDGTGKAVPRSGGLVKASCDPSTIRGWWGIKWPMAMVGLATGHGRLFVVDFDPRVEEEIDKETGEVIGRREWTLDQLKADLEAQIGGPLPATLAAMTPSGGVHLYFLWPDDGGEPIRNRGNLPDHVDVRGLGGYVIAPPSVMEDGLRYRWLRGMGPDDVAIAAAPAALVEILRAPKKAAQGAGGGRQAPIAAPAGVEAVTDDAVRKYALAGLDAELQAVRRAGSGRRNAQLNESALKIASLVAAGALDATLARYSLEAAARDNPGRDSDGQLIATIDSGWSAGLNNPRDLVEVAAAARERASRQGRGRASGSSGRPAPSSPGAFPAPPERRSSSSDPSGPEGMAGQIVKGGSGGAPPALSEAERWRLARIAEAWLAGRLARVERTRDAMTALAWGVGRRVAAGLLDEDTAREMLWPEYELVADVQHKDIDRAIDEGKARGFDPGPALADLRCALRPMTDFGLAERFLERHGDRFLFTTAKGWLGWDGRRWAVLDQDKETLPASLIAAVFDTIRDVQRETRRIAETGLKLALVDKGKQKELDLGDEDVHALDYWVPVGWQWKRFSTMLAAWGRQCEQAGKPAAIANLVRGTPGLVRGRWLTVPFERFDCEKLAINVLNGTLRFAVETLPDGRRKASVRLDGHRREDLITRLAPIDYDLKAEAPLYDGMLQWAQPDPAMRRYLHQVGGYTGTGEIGEHKLWYNWGRGRNGKSTTIDSWCSALGDYSGTIGIESFLDQGIKKRGDQATPDLAKLTGVRMLRASESERGAKLNSALVKAVTGGEPMSVRALHRGFFDLIVRFKLLMSGNFKPEIPDTDDGIWGRMKLIPWLRHIEKPEEDPFHNRYPDSHQNWPVKDLDLLDKIKGAEHGGKGKGELSGVFRQLVEGLCDWLENGLVEPDEVTGATQAYRDQSDPLARFLLLCTVPDREGRVKSSELHAAFEAWCKLAQETPWKPKGFANAMIDKGFAKTRSDGMRWIGLSMIPGISFHTDDDEKLRATLPELGIGDGDGTVEERGTGPPRPEIAAAGDFDDDGLPID